MGRLTGRHAWGALFALAVGVQLVALYLPDPPSGGGVPGSDKVVHVAIFLAPALLGLLAGIRPAVLASLLVVHAVVSEVVQHALLPGRSGDPTDAVADLVGTAIGLTIGSALLLRARDGRPGGRASDDAPRGSGGPQPRP